MPFIAAPFQRDKFKELVLYIAERCATDAGFGKTRLYKTLWWSDFQAFARLGRPITGARYVRFPFGPVPKQVWDILDELETERAIYWESRPVRGDHTQERLCARRTPDLSLFTAQERELIDGVISALWNRKATGVSNLSHKKSAGWRLADDRGTIPYETVFVSRRKAKPSDRAWAKAVAKQHGWLGGKPAA